MADEPLWKVTNRHRAILSVVAPDNECKAEIRFDGCTHFWYYYNGTTPQDADPDVEYLHICDVENLIARLQALVKEARTYFGEQWPQ